jgi:hypothetical protein
MIYFGVTAFFEWKAVRKAKLRIKEQSKTISVVSPIILDNNSNEGS